MKIFGRSYLFDNSYDLKNLYCEEKKYNFYFLI